MAELIGGRMYYRSGEGPDDGEPIAIVLEPEDDPPIMGIHQVRLRARPGVNLTQLDELGAQMRRLLSGDVWIQMAD